MSAQPLCLDDAICLLAVNCSVIPVHAPATLVPWRIFQDRHHTPPSALPELTHAADHPRADSFPPSKRGVGRK